MTSWLLRDPFGTPIAQRYGDGSNKEYYYLFDGQGDVVAMEDPGMVVASYDYCPTGNEADLAGGTNPMTAAGLGNPLRQGAAPYDDGTKDYIGTNGVITEDYNGTATQGPAMANGDCMSGARLAEAGRRISIVAAASTGGTEGGPPAPNSNTPVILDCPYGSTAVITYTAPPGFGNLQVLFENLPDDSLSAETSRTVVCTRPNGCNGFAAANFPPRLTRRAAYANFAWYSPEGRGVTDINVVCI